MVEQVGVLATCMLKPTKKIQNSTGKDQWPGMENVQYGVWRSGRAFAGSTLGRSASR